MSNGVCTVCGMKEATTAENQPRFDGILTAVIGAAAFALGIGVGFLSGKKKKKSTAE